MKDETIIFGEKTQNEYEYKEKKKTHNVSNRKTKGVIEENVASRMGKTLANVAWVWVLSAVVFFTVKMEIINENFSPLRS